MKLIVFFNGWGMNEKIIEKVQKPDNYEILNISFPYEFDVGILKSYEEYIFVGWSFGVYYLCEFLASHKELQPEKVVGINGTPEIIGKFGIASKVFSLTTSSMNLENLKKFYRNMDYKGEVISENITDLIYQLEYLEKNYSPKNNYITKVFIGDKDKVIKSKNQWEYFKTTLTNTISFPCGHYPFNVLSSWEEIIK